MHFAKILHRESLCRLMACFVVLGQSVRDIRRVVYISMSRLRCKLFTAQPQSQSHRLAGFETMSYDFQPANL